MDPSINSQQLWRCANCQISTTPVRRNGPQGKKSLCNACGLRHSKQKRAKEAARSAAARNNPSSFVKLEPATISTGASAEQRHFITEQNQRETRSCSDLPGMGPRTSSSPTSVSEPRSAPAQLITKKRGVPRDSKLRQARFQPMKSVDTQPAPSSSVKHQAQLPFTSLSREISVDDEDMAPLLKPFTYGSSITPDQELSVLMSARAGAASSHAASEDFFDNPGARIFGEEDTNGIQRPSGFEDDSHLPSTSDLPRADVPRSRREVRAAAQNISGIDEWLARSHISLLEARIRTLENERVFMQGIIEQSKTELSKKDAEIRQLRSQLERTFRAWTDALFPVSSTTTSVEHNNRKSF